MPNLCKPKMRRDVTHSRGEKQLLDLRQNQEPKSWAPGKPLLIKNSVESELFRVSIENSWLDYL